MITTFDKIRWSIAVFPIVGFILFILICQTINESNTNACYDNILHKVNVGDDIFDALEKMDEGIIFEKPQIRKFYDNDGTPCSVKIIFNYVKTDVGDSYPVIYFDSETGKVTRVWSGFTG